MALGPTSNEVGEPAGRGPWWWVPSLYFAQGVPYVVVMTVAVIVFKRLGVGNAQIALYTSWLYLPYAIKPLWSPLVQRIGTRRAWVVVMQLFVAVGLASVALAIPLESFVRWSLVALATVAVCSATHDVAADGFYLLGLTTHQQAWFVGIRSTAYRMATIAGQGLLVMLAGALESSTGLPVIDIPISAAAGASTQKAFAPEDFGSPNFVDSQGILAAHTKYQMSFGGINAAMAKSAKDAVREWNVSHGFYPVPDSAAQKMAAKPVWLQHLEAWIRSNFGTSKDRTVPAQDRVGDVAIVLLRLAKPVASGEQQIVQFGRAAGDSNFDVVEGERFVLNEANSNYPFAALVQVDPKLDHPSGATFQVRSGNLRLAWLVTFLVVAGGFMAFCVYHYLVLPRPAADIAESPSNEAMGFMGFLVPFVDFFRKPRIIAILAFLLLFRFPEAQLIKLSTPFLLDPREVGGLALTTAEVGIVYGTIGIAMLTLGGLTGGFIVARGGFGRSLWPMALAIHLPNLAFLFLAYAQPESRLLITAAVAVEQFGYGFGFTAYMLYCVYVATGRYQTVHYALCTGCMALGMMIPGMWSGWLEELVGYQHFFVWIMLAMIPSLIAVALIPYDPDFGKKTASQLAI
jgi:MFS transporter, PAT family, beta-lactamase induction signal transducer AmpG